MTSITSSHSQPAHRIRRERRPGLEMIIVDRFGLREFHITLLPLPGESPSEMLLRLNAQLREHEAMVVKHDVFGSVAAASGMMADMKRVIGETDWPVTFVECAPCAGATVAGMQLLAVAGTPVETVRLEGRPVGRVFHDAFSKQCLLGDVVPADISESKTTQAWRVYDNIEVALGKAGFLLSELVRTWLFLDDILGWYGPFNLVRTEIFTQRNLFRECVPASTGIGAKNPCGAALVAGAWAVQPKGPTPAIREVPSPLQCPARSYGSCFSRAVELDAPDVRRLLISGTASIHPDGRSARTGDARGQVDLTMEVVEAILASRKLGFSDVTRATAYFKKGHDAGALADWCLERGTSLPVVVTKSDVCRDELLFEIELDAMTAGSGPVDLSTRSHLEKVSPENPAKAQSGWDI